MSGMVWVSVSRVRRRDSGSYAAIVMDVSDCLYGLIQWLTKGLNT